MPTVILADPGRSRPVGFCKLDENQLITSNDFIWYGSMRRPIVGRRGTPQPFKLFVRETWAPPHHPKQRFLGLLRGLELNFQAEQPQQSDRMHVLLSCTDRIAGGVSCGFSFKSFVREFGLVLLVPWRNIKVVS